jgi:ribosomal-protein-alanine N-acetyltransferase
MKVRPGRASDLDFIAGLEREAFLTPWSRQALRMELENAPDRMPLIAEADGQARGYAFVWIVADELHVVNIAVDPSVRRRGFGRLLMAEILRRGRSMGSKLVTLEVRMGNRPARALYADMGFREVAIRPNYYPTDREDALVMIREIHEAGDRASA